MRVLSTALALFLVAASVFVWMVDPEARQYLSPGAWFLLPGIAVALVIGSRYFAVLLERRPGMLNLPDKGRFQSLPVERQRPVIRHGQGMMDWLGLETTIVIGLIQLAIYHQRGSEGLSVYMIAVLAFAFVFSPIITFYYIGKMQSEVSRQLREMKAEGVSGGRAEVK